MLGKLRLEVRETLLGDALALLSGSERPPSSRVHPAVAGADNVYSHCGQCLIKCFSSKADNSRDCSISWIIIKFLKLFNSWGRGGHLNHCTLLRARPLWAQRPAPGQSAALPCDSHNEISRVSFFSPTSIRSWRGRKVLSRRPLVLNTAHWLHHLESVKIFHNYPGGITWVNAAICQFYQKEEMA